MDEKKAPKQKPKKRIRDKVVKFYATEKELKQIEKNAKRAGLNRREFLRKTAIEKEVVVNEITALEDFRKFIYELNKIGINFNQFLKKINTDIDTLEDFENFKYNQDQLKKILDNIYEISEEVRKWQQ